MTRLADYTTLRIGGPAKRLVTATSMMQLAEIVIDCDNRGEPVLLIGGGSNLLIADEGFDGTAVLVRPTDPVQVSSDGWVEAAAGEVWDEFVAQTIEQGWAGLAALSGIPGMAGATPVQNVGAYGAEVAQTLTRVTVLDRRDASLRFLPAAECEFGYRWSKFKREPDRYVVMAASFKLAPAAVGEPVEYPELARELGVEVGQRVAPRKVRQAVLAVRRRKAMVLDAADHDTWSAGSFFTNPVISEAQAERLPAEAPRYPAAQGIKTSAAWLIQAAGFDRGYGKSAAQLSSRHVLAITNRGGASAADVVALAAEIRDGVEQRFGLRLVPEPKLVGVSLDS
ncbi:MAG: UDP-N-acetylenolpyruvoylglucosamine reductase [Arachnia propionica]|nr:MAG: UDP-N-acetylenolpyruvoylglucosamine reductase [Arachnia propionica]